MVAEDPAAGPAYFRDDRRDEFLAAESWMDRHQQEQVEVRKVWPDSGEWSFRVDGHAGDDAKIADRARHPREIAAAGLDMDRQIFGACGGGCYLLF